MNIEMKKVNEKINHIEELMTTFISQLAAKGLQTPSEHIEVIHFNSKNRSDDALTLALIPPFSPNDVISFILIANL